MQKRIKIRIAIVCQLFYPQQTPRAMRATELAKEFARQGHKTIVYCLTGGFDYSEFESNFNLKVENIGNAKFGLITCSTPIRSNNGKSGHSLCSNIKSTLVKTIRKYLRLPELELTRLVRRKMRGAAENYDLIISIGRPYEIHWGVGLAKGASESFPIWISDCGDPFMGNPFSKEPFYFKGVEKWWGRNTDFVTIPIEEARNAYYPEIQDKISIIPQGFNFAEIEKGTYKKNEVPTFVYAGALYKNLRDPQKLLEYLVGVDKPFVFKVFTNDTTLLDDYRESLGDRLEVSNYIPRKDLIKLLSEADFVINIRNSSTVQSPSKLIDYFYAGRPILEVTSEFDKNQRETFEEFLSGDYRGQVKPVDIDKYLIENIVAAFLSLYSK